MGGLIGHGETPLPIEHACVGRLFGAVIVFEESNTIDFGAPPEMAFHPMFSVVTSRPSATLRSSISHSEAIDCIV